MHPPLPGPVGVSWFVAASGPNSTRLLVADVHDGLGASHYRTERCGKRSTVRVVKKRAAVKTCLW